MEAMAHGGSGDIATPAQANPQANEVSINEEPTSQMLGRDDQMRRRSRLV